MKRSRISMQDNELVTEVAVMKRKLDPQKHKGVRQMICPLRSEMLNKYFTLSLKKRSVSVRKLVDIIENSSKNIMRESFELF
jgi:hypothetical protein